LKHATNHVHKRSQLKKKSNKKFIFIEKISFTTVLLIFAFTTISYAEYDGYKRNADGSYSVGGAYDGYKTRQQYSIT